MTSLRSKAVRAFLRHQRDKNQPLSMANIAQKRAAYDTFERFFPVPARTKITPVTQYGFTGEWVTVPTARTNKVMLYMHGGGFLFNSLKLHRGLVSRIASAGMIKALSVTYRLVPDHPFPAALDDVLVAYKWLLERYDPKNIVVAGDSAGGSLALSLMHVLIREGLPTPACVIAIAPATDAAAPRPSVTDHNDAFITREDIDTIIDMYFKDTPRDDPIASPLYGSLAGFPPLLLHADTDEFMYPGVARFAAKAKQQGVDVTFYERHDLWHVWHLFAPYVPEARRAIRHIGEFIRLHSAP